MKKFLAFVDEAYETVVGNDCPIVFLSFESDHDIGTEENRKNLVQAIFTHEKLDFEMSQLYECDLISQEIAQNKILEVVS